MIQFKVTFKSGTVVMAEAFGRELPPARISLSDIEKVTATEQFLEHLTGLRVHIEQV